jgi:hypothetical protein
MASWYELRKDVWVLGGLLGIGRGTSTELLRYLGSEKRSGAKKGMVLFDHRLICVLAIWDLEFRVFRFFMGSSLALISLSRMLDHISKGHGVV